MKKIIIYQIFTRLFGNKNNACKSNGTLCDNGSGKFNDITDKALKEIHSLGSTHVWFTGVIEHATQTDYSTDGITPDKPCIVKGKAGSPYAIKDYYDVDPDLAVNVQNRMSEFESLIHRTHANNLKVIMDFVPNHVARQYHSDVKASSVGDLGANDDTSVHFLPQNNFYYIPRQAFAPGIDCGKEGDKYEEYPAKATGNDCFGAFPNQNDWYETVKLNYGVDYLHNKEKHFDPTPDTWYKMRDILLFWSSKGIDGFRCDMAEMVPVEFWGWVIPQIKQRYPQIDFIAEIYNPQEYRNYIFNGKFDYLYDKVGLYDTLRSIVCGNLSASNITYCWQAVDGINKHMLNFLENHDEQRIASDYFAANPFKAIPALIVATTMNTNPFMLYFGQEIGEPGMDQEGFSGKDGRTSIFDYWSIASIRNWANNGKFNTQKLTPEQKKLRAIYQKTLTLCNHEIAIREGSFFDLMYVNTENKFFNPHKQYTYLRKKDSDLLLIAVNFDAYDADIAINLPEHAFTVMEISTDKTEIDFTDLLSGDTVKNRLSAEYPFRTKIKAFSAVIWKTKLKAGKIKTKKVN